MRSRDRINVHLYIVRLSKPSPVGIHFNGSACHLEYLKVFFFEILPVSSDKDGDKVKRLDLERKWQIKVKSMTPFGMSTVPSPANSAVIPFVIPFSETAKGLFTRRNI